ncbi:MAG: DUF6588 family protein [bacterium]
MRRYFLFGLLFTIFVCLNVQIAQAQYFKFDTAPDEETIRSEVNAILKFFGSIVGGGLFHTADLHSVGGIDVGLRGVVANVPENFKDLPVFSKENMVGLAFLHGSFGLPGNFELLGRFFYFPLGSSVDMNASPPRATDSRGGVTLIGGGIKYGLLQLPALPKIMVMGTYHALFVPEEFDFGTVSTISFNGVASYSLPIITVYAGGGIDITTLKLNEDFLNGGRFNERMPHLTLGAQIQPLPLIHVNGSYNFSEFASFDLGIGISFR